jgi:hypothetical protein
MRSRPGLTSRRYIFSTRFCASRCSCSFFPSPAAVALLVSFVLVAVSLLHPGLSVSFQNLVPNPAQRCYSTKRDQAIPAVCCVSPIVWTRTPQTGSLGGMRSLQGSPKEWWTPRYRKARDKISLYLACANGVPPSQSDDGWFVWSL